MGRPRNTPEAGDNGESPADTEPTKAELKKKFPTRYAANLVFFKIPAEERDKYHVVELEESESYAIEPLGE